MFKYFVLFVFGFFVGNFMNVRGPVFPFQQSALGPLSSNFNSLPEVVGLSNVEQGILFDDRGGFRSIGQASGPGSAKTGSRSGGETTVDQKAGHHSVLSGMHNTHSDSTNGKSSASLTVATDMASVVHDMLMPDSGLEIHDRTWLKITIPNAFIGNENKVLYIDFLRSNVYGLSNVYN